MCSNVKTCDNMRHLAEIFALALVMLVTSSVSAADLSGQPGKEDLPGGDAGRSDGAITLTSEECNNRGGRIVNNMADESCSTTEMLVGIVTGMRCKCICCVPTKKKKSGGEQEVL